MTSEEKQAPKTCKDIVMDFINGVKDIPPTNKRDAATLPTPAATEANGNGSDDNGGGGGDDDGDEIVTLHYRVAVDPEKFTGTPPNAPQGENAANATKTGVE